MRRGLLVAATVGSIALGSFLALLGMQAPRGPGPITAVASSPSPASSALATASPIAPSPGPTAPTSIPAPVGPLLTERVRGVLQASLDELRRKYAIPGISVSVVLADGSSWTGVSGLADVAAARPVTPNTAFAVASISKTFIAALILDLSAEGRLGLEDAATKYLPEQKMLTGITIRMLLDHTSGLNDYFLNPKIDRALQADPTADWTSARALSFVAKPYFPPGTGWHYSNTNYLFLGLIAELVGGRPLAEQLRSRYFDPLGLKSTYYQVAERPRGPTAHGYRFTGLKRNLPPLDVSDGTGTMPFRAVVTAAGGAGSVAATSFDLARWARALYGGRVLDPEGLALMLDGFDHTAAYHPPIPYGLGVQIVEIGGRQTFGHSGRLLGFRGVVRYLPEEDLAIAVLTNQSRVDSGVIAAALLAVVVPPPGPCGLCLDPS